MAKFDDGFTPLTISEAKNNKFDKGFIPISFNDEGGQGSTFEDKLRAAVDGPSEPSGFLRRAVVDPAVSLVKGVVVGIPEDVVGLADIPTMGYAGKGADALLKSTLGGGFKEGNEFFDQWLSPETREARQKVSEAKGFVETVGTALANPSSIVASVAESLPSMFGGAGLGRLALKGLGKGVLGKEALEAALKGLSKEEGEALIKKNMQRAIAGGAVGEGLITAGQNTEGVRQQTEDGTLSPMQVAATTGSGFVTGLISRMSGGLASRLKIPDVDALMQGAYTGETKLTAMTVLKGLIGSAITEGALEELPQSAQEQMAQNIALGKPTFEGVAEAGAMGLLAGMAMGVMGGGAGMIKNGGKDEKQPPDNKPPEPPDNKPPNNAARKARLLEVLDTGLQSGKYQNKDFTPETAIKYIDYAHKHGIISDTELDDLKAKYPQLRDGLNGVIAENITKKIDEAVTNAATNPVTNTTQNLADVPDFQEEEQTGTTPEVSVIDDVNAKLKPESVETGAKAEGETKKLEYKSAEEWEKDNFTEAEIAERRKYGITPETEWEPTFRGASKAEWTSIQNGGTLQSEGLDEKTTFTTPSKELASTGGRFGDADVIIQFKPEAKSRMREGDEKFGSKEYYANGLNINDVLRVTDKNGNVIYDATNQALPAPLSQTDAATVGVTTDEAKSGESSPVLSKLQSSIHAIPDGTRGKKQIVAALKELNGSSDSPVKALSAIQRMKNNLMHMGDGNTQLQNDIDAIEQHYKKQGYEIDDLLGRKYDPGMKVIATWKPGEGEWQPATITKIIKPQINKDGVMSSVAQIEVTDWGEKPTPAAPEVGQAAGEQSGEVNLGQKGAANPELKKEAPNEKKTETLLKQRGFSSLPQHSQDKFNAAFETGDVKTLQVYLESQNLRDEFEKRTGVKLPDNKKERTTAISDHFKKKETPKKTIIEKAPYGRSGMAAFNKMAGVAGLKDATSNPDYNDLVNYFETYYNAGLQGKAKPKVDIHPQDAEAAYQAGKKDAAKPEKKAAVVKTSGPTVLKGTYTSEGDTEKDLRENGSDTPERKFKADLKQYAKKLQEILGYEPDVITKGKKSKDTTVSTNIAPVGGDGHIILWKPNSEYGIYISVRAERDAGNDSIGDFGNDKLTINPRMMYRATTRKDKYSGMRNQWISGNISAEDLARKIKAEVDFYDQVKGAAEIIQEAKDEHFSETAIAKVFAEGEAIGEAEGADKSVEEIQAKIDEVAAELVVEVKPFLQETGVSMKGGKLVLDHGEVAKPADLSAKSTGDLVKDMFDIINDHIGERGSISTKEVDETLYQKLKPYLLEIVKRAKAKALDARAYLFGAVDSMPDGKAKDVYEAAARKYVDELDNEHYEKSANKEEAKTPFQYGQEAFARGAKAIPAQDKDFLDTLAGKIDVRNDLDQWISGWTQANLAVRNYPGVEKNGMNTEQELDGIDVNDIDNAPKKDYNISKEGEKNEHSADGSTGEGALESDESGNLPADGRGQGTRRGKRSSRQTDNQGNEDLDAGGLDGSGSLAGEPAPIHLQDSGTDGEVLSAGSSAVDEAPASEPRSIQLSGINPGNYRITEEDDIGSGTRGQKIDRNIAAIRLIKKLDQEKRYPTKEEQSVLAKYVGWGGIKNVFDETSNKPQDQRAYADLKELLTKEEFFEARQSVLNAHYTSPQVIRSIYKIMKHFGFTGGNILEPTYGAGNFIGLMPEDMAASSKWYGSELDPITAKIGQYLYPDSQLIHSGFQTAEFPYGKFDAEVGNPPFGDVRIADTRKDRAEINRMKIHNYVISKSGLHLRPGGISANVITTRFLDTADPEARDFLAKQFKFLGAIRLPNNAFANNAGTEVTTDLVFFQRLMPGEKPDMSADWLTTGATITNKDGEEITLNKYFAERPELMLGEPSMKGTMYGGAWKEGGKGEFTLNKREGVDIEEAIDKVIRESFFDLKDVARSNNDKLDAAALSLIPNKEDVAIGGFFMDKDRIYMREDNDEYGNPTYTRLSPKTKWTEKQLLGETRYLRIKGMLEIRAKAYELVNAERFDLSNIDQLRKQLNFLYDNFVKDYGFINESSNFSLMSDDIKIEFGLEIDFKKEITKAKAKSLGVKPSPSSAQKATILNERMFYPEKEILYAKDSADGYNISLSQKGKLDIDYIATLTGTTKESVIADLSKDGLIYQDPDTKEWIQEDEYLSGNVKEKYKKVEGKEGFEKNAEALKKVFPADVGAEDIFANPGATWIPEKVYEQFGHFIGVENPSVSIYRNNGQFVMRSAGQKQNDINVAWLNSYYSMPDIFNAVANNKVLIAWDGSGDDRVQNKEQTAELATIVQNMRSTFFDWIFADDTRTGELTKIYNDTQNTHAKRKNDGTHLHTVGASPAVILRNTQRDAAWRIIQSKRVLLDHCVGAGKTYTIITGVQERVRMGLTRKAMIAVPNHLVGQWAADYMRLYPGARILAATKKDFSAPNRRRLFARIATGKYDAIIVGHSSFGFIPLETESLTNLMMEEIAQLEAAEAQAKADGNKRLVKTLANRIAKKREKITELLGRPKDNVTTFEAMGIDHLVVDESHEFKNLEYSSAMQNITGMGNPMGSKRAFDLYAKIRWLTAQKDYALNFATGTPISNSLVEMYALLRYMNRDALYARGIDAFDSWANTYASIEPRIEYTASQKLKQRTVMATFNNLPELLQLYEEFADIVTMPDLKRIYAEQIRERNARTGGNESEEFPVPKVKDGGRTLDVADPSPEQVEYVDYLVARAERLEEAGRSNDPKIDNHLWIMGDARKMALDIRLVDPTAKESTDNKINRATKNIKEIYDRTEKDKGAQLVFCDLSTPSGSAQKNAAVFIREALKKAHLENDARTKAILDSLSTYQEKWGYLRNRLEAEIEAITDHSQAETEQYMRRREEIEDYLEKVTDDVTADLTTADTGFSVYDEMKSKLIMMGIPDGEIKFIHSANTEQQKEDLFAMVNSGQVRVLLGSSQKMGAGMNVQERLVALHHMDAPWRPSDVEQREGRLVRQGNKLYSVDPVGFKVEIKAYSTSNTFDAVMWQILARKGGMLDDFRSGRRSIEEVNTDGANYSEFMAETTGNPAFKEKFQLESDIKSLEAIKNRTTTRLRSSQQSLDYNKDSRIQTQQENEKRDKIINDLKGQSSFTLEGKQYKDNAKALVDKEADDIAEYNARVNKEYNTAIDAAINKAFEDKYKNSGWKYDTPTGWNWAWIRPLAPLGVQQDNSKAFNDYREAVATYQLFMEDEEHKKIIAEAVKEIKKPTNKHFHSTKLAKSDKSGVIAAGLKIVDEINALDEGETFSYRLGNTEIAIKKEESGWTDKEAENPVQLWDYVVTADGMFLRRFEHDKSFDERNIWNLLNVEFVSNRMADHRRYAANYIERMDKSDEVSRHTLESLKFKDDEKLQKMKSRYQEVINEVAIAEFEISARRAATGNKYIQDDRPRFPDGVWEPKGNQHNENVELPEVDIDEDIDSLKAKLKSLKKETNEDLLDDKIAAAHKLKYRDDTEKELNSISTNYAINLAEMARVKALLSQTGEGTIKDAQSDMDAAYEQWSEYHEGEVYPYEIKLAQLVVNSIRSGQGRLFKGQQYSINAPGPYQMPGLADVQEVFKGQKVTQLPTGAYLITLKNGADVVISEVSEITPNGISLNIGYSKNSLSEKEAIAGSYRKAHINLVKGQADKWTLAHESVHFMEDIGVIDDQEVKLLQRHIKNLVADGKFQTQNKDDIGGSEDRAEFLAQALQKEPKGLLGLIINKIQDFIDKIVNAFGTRTVRGIQRDIRSGKAYGKETNTQREARLDLEQYMTAWHGSPHTFDKFSKDKIGTGEGAQAYGSGLYFTSVRDIAEFYREKLSDGSRGGLGLAGVMPSATDKSLSYNAWSAAKQLTELLVSNSGEVKSFSSLNVVEQGRVLSMMHRLLENDEVLNTVVGFIPVDVVNVLGGKERSAKYLLHHPTMLIYLLPRNTDNLVPSSVPAMNVLAQAVTLGAAKVHTGLSRFDVRPSDFLSASGTLHDIPPKSISSKIPKPNEFVKGHLYEVELAPDDDEYLLWDKPLSEQSEKVKEALVKATQQHPEILPPGLFLGLTGQDIYQTLKDKAKNGIEPLPGQQEAFDQGRLSLPAKPDKLASEYLHSLGIRGIKYLDGTSRNKGEGNYNYVIFSEDDIEITERYNIRQADPHAAYWNLEKTKYDTSLYNLVDKHIDVKDVISAIKMFTRGIVDEAKDVYLKVTNYSGRLDARYKEFMQKEFQPVMEALSKAGITRGQFEEYLLMRHAKEANAYYRRNKGTPDGGSGILDAKVDAYFRGKEVTVGKYTFDTLSTEANTKMQPIADMIDAITHKSAQTLLDYGVESNSTIGKWLGSYQHYVPLSRDDDPVYDRPKPVGFSVSGSSSARRQGGSDKMPLNILANIAEQREKYIKRGEKNIIAKALYSLAKNNPNPKFWRLAKPRVVPRRNAATGELVPVVDAPSDKEPMIILFREIGADGEIIERGVEFNAKNERAARMALALKNLDLDSIGAVLGTMAKVTRYMASINTQYNPIFGITNFFRDLGTMAFNLSTTPIAGKQAQVAKGIPAAMMGISQALRGNLDSPQAKLFKEFQMMGGQTGYVDLYKTAEDRTKEIDKQLKMINGKAPIRGLINWAGGALSNYNTSIENAVRLSAYEVGIANGMSKEKAAAMAKDLTVNFNRKGQWASQAGAMYAFFNASVQGSVRMYETLKGPKARKIIAGGLIFGAVQAMALAAAGFGDDEPPDFVRERNIIIPIGGKKYITIPMPLGFNVIPSLGRIPVEIALAGGKNADKKMFSLFGLVLEAFNPMGSSGLSLQTFMPTIADPFVALAENKDWTGKPIYKENFNSLNPAPGHARAKDTSSLFGQGLSYALNMATGGSKYTPGYFSPTPDQIDYLVGQATGGVGREIGKASQTVRAINSGEELPTYKIPVVSRFYGNAEGASHEGRKFYDNVKEMNMFEREIKGLRSEGKSVSEYLKDNPEARYFAMANKTEAIIRKLKTRRDQLKDRDANPEVIKRIDDQITTRMRRLNEIIDRAKKT